jgi:hypothetical protein
MKLSANSFHFNIQNDRSMFLRCKNLFLNFPKIVGFDTPFGKVICDHHEVKKLSSLLAIFSVVLST